MVTLGVRGKYMIFMNARSTVLKHFNTIVETSSTVSLSTAFIDRSGLK